MDPYPVMGVAYLTMVGGFVMGVVSSSSTKGGVHSSSSSDQSSQPWTGKGNLGLVRATLGR